MAVTVEKLPIPPLTLGEGPYWDIASQSLYLVDLLDASLVRYDPVTNKSFYAKLDIPKASFIIPVAGNKGMFVVGCELCLYLIKWDACSDNIESAEILYKVSADPKASSINDGKCDSTGRLWFGTMTKDKSSAAGRLYSFRKDEGCREHVSQIGISNGISWDLEGNSMYYIDSIAYAVDVFDYKSNGSIDNRRVLFDLKKNGISSCFPDGMTTDKNGNLWVACFNGSQVINVDSKSGELLNKVTIPTSQVTSVAWGGPNLEDLYVTTGNFHPEIGHSITVEDQYCPNAGFTFRVSGLATGGLLMNQFKL